MLFFKNRNKENNGNQQPSQQSEVNLNTTKITDGISIHLAKENIKQNNEIEFIFETIGPKKEKIRYYSNKPMRELIILYFKKIGLSELFGSDKIRFLKGGEIIEHNSNNLIYTYINTKNPGNIILVDDQEDKV